MDVKWQDIVINQMKKDDFNYYDNSTAINMAFVELHRNKTCWENGKKRVNHFLVSQNCTENETETYRLGKPHRKKSALIGDIVRKGGGSPHSVSFGGSF